MTEHHPRYLWQLDRAIRLRLEPVESLVDLGCGARPQTTLRAPRIVNVDVWRAYLDAAPPPRVLADLRQPLPFRDGAFDVAWCSDVLEHLDRVAGYRLVREAQRVSRRGVVVRTPLGWQAQAAHDAWGLGECQHQEHRSGWWPRDLPGERWVIEGRSKDTNGWYHRGWWAVWVPASPPLYESWASNPKWKGVA